MALKYLISNILVVFNLNGGFSIYSYLFILFGFLGGNLFGCLFSILPVSSLFIVISLVLCLEAYSYVYYKNYRVVKKKVQQKTSMEHKCVFISTQINIKKRKMQTLNFIKIGFLFGVFVDAFKVGS